MTFPDQLFNAKQCLTIIVCGAAGFLLGGFDFNVLIDQVMKMRIFIQHWPQEQVKDVPVPKQLPVSKQRH